jgi:pilus assembly protein CpaB
MKWTYIVLVVVGLIAALGVAVVVGGLRNQPGTRVVSQPPKGQMVVAARGIDAMTVIDSASVEVVEVDRSDLEPDAIGSPARVVGRVLAVPVKAGQAFRRSDFADRGSGATLASALPDGKRAMTVSLSDHASLEGLLYPGSVVDILACFHDPDDRQNGLSRRLLENVQVLAVEAETVFTDQESPVAGRSRQRRVTVLLDPAQAQALQLAQERGVISLAMRNPMDRVAVDAEPTMLRDLVGLNARLASDVGIGEAKLWPAMEFAPAAEEQDQAAAAVEIEPDTQSAQVREVPQTWAIEIIRGATSEVKSFPISGSARGPGARQEQ